MTKSRLRLVLSLSYVQSYDQVTPSPKSGLRPFLILGYAQSYFQVTMHY
jgi:hypothetical protein